MYQGSRCSQTVLEVFLWLHWSVFPSSLIPLCLYFPRFIVRLWAPLVAHAHFLFLPGLYWSYPEVHLCHLLFSLHVLYITLKIKAYSYNLKFLFLSLTFTVTFRLINGSCYWKVPHNPLILSKAKIKQFYSSNSLFPLLQLGRHYHFLQSRWRQKWAIYLTLLTVPHFRPRIQNFLSILLQYIYFLNENVSFHINPAIYKTLIISHLPITITLWLVFLHISWK